MLKTKTKYLTRQYRAVCEHCGWQKEGDRSVIDSAHKHQRETGHTVLVDYQVKYRQSSES